MFKRKKIIFLIIAAIIVSLVVVKIIRSNSSGSQYRSNYIVVKTENPVIQDINQKLEYTGNIDAVQRADIFSKVSGNLENTFADIGDFVKEGQLLAVVDSNQLYQNYQQAFATYSNSKRIYERNAELYKQDLIARQDLDNSESSMKITEAVYRNAAIQLSYSKITAPFSGYITKKFLDRGALIQNNNSTIFTLMKTDVVKIYVYILEKDLPLILDNSKCIVTVDAYPGKNFYGKITRKSNALDLNTQTMTYEIDIMNKDHLLKPGMFATVDFILSEHKNAITLPKDVVLTDSSGSFVFINLNGKAKRVDVNTGIVQNNIIEITGGLGDSSEIITTGQEYVKDNVPVKIQKNEEH